MRELFNNREIAIIFWSALFFGLVLSKKEISHSIFQALKTFFSVKIIIPFAFLFFYSALAVIILWKINLWSISNLKETIYWFLFSGVIIAFTTIIDEKTKKPIRKILKELITFTVILEFIVNTYIFKLHIEMILVPTIAFMIMLHTYASTKNEYKMVEKIAGALLAIIGIGMFIHALTQVYFDFDKLRNFNSLINFVLPPILTISILPVIYMMMLYASYEMLFVRVNIMLDSLEKQRYAKKLLILHCGFSVGKTKDILKFRVSRLYKKASKEEIKNILFPDKKLK